MLQRLFSVVSPRTYEKGSKQRNDAILSKLCADSFTMPDPQVAAPAVQAHAPAQADEVSLEVCETLFSLSSVSCFVSVLVRPVLLVCPFYLWGLRAIF